jgi:hypothetical protein
MIHYAKLADGVFSGSQGIADCSKARGSILENNAATKF